MYRVGLEAILGFTKRGETLRIRPCLPDAWPGFSITYRYGRSTYDIAVQRSSAGLVAAHSIVLDGVSLAGDEIPLIDDGRTHTVHVSLAKLSS